MQALPAGSLLTGRIERGTQDEQVDGVQPRDGGDRLAAFVLLGGTPVETAATGSPGLPLAALSVRGYRVDEGRRPRRVARV